MINLLHEWDVISWDEIEERERVKRKKDFPSGLI